MPFNKSDAPRRSARPMHRRKKVCVFCGKENNEIDYKDTAKLKKYVSEHYRQLREASESSDRSDQESPPRGPYAVRAGLIGNWQLQ